MCVSVCVCVCTSQNWPKRRCRHGKKIACKSSNRLRSSLRRCRRRCCRLFCDSQLFNFPIFQWKYSGLKSKSSPNLCQQEWCFSMYYMYIYIYLLYYIYCHGFGHGFPWIILSFTTWFAWSHEEYLEKIFCLGKSQRSFLKQQRKNKKTYLALS